MSDTAASGDFIVCQRRASVRIGVNSIGHCGTALLRSGVLRTFLEDLSDRGLLAETLVVAMGEFGRTSKLGQVTSNAAPTPPGATTGRTLHSPGSCKVI